MENAAVLSPFAMSTSQLPPGERFDAWREIFALQIARVDASTPDRERFHADVRAQPLPQLMVSKNTVGSCRLMRTPQLIRDGDDSLAFVICVAGSGDVIFGDTVVSLTPGRATLVPHHRLGTVVAHDTSTTVSIVLDRETARSLCPSVDKMLLRETALGDPTVSILSAYCKELLALPGGVPRALAALAASQIRELVSHALNPAGDLARAAPFGGVKAARLRAVLDDISARLHDPALSAATAGQRLGLTQRYVQQLMDGIGVSFSQHVRNLRLDAARGMLRDAASGRLRITDIAYAVGFQDLSYFNREFRRRFGETPSDSRRPR